MWTGARWLSHVTRGVRNVIIQPEAMIRASALERVGGRLADIPAASDFNLWLRLASVGSVARVNGPVQGLYRKHAKSMQRTIHSGKHADWLARIAAFDRFFDGPPVDRRRSGLLARARRSLALDGLRLAIEDLDDGSRPRPRSRPIADAHRSIPGS